MKPAIAIATTYVDGKILLIDGCSNKLVIQVNALFKNMIELTSVVDTVN